MSKINDYACGASCVFSFRWKGMSTNGGCTCLHSMKDIKDRRLVQLNIKAYKEELLRLQAELSEAKGELLDAKR